MGSSSGIVYFIYLFISVAVADHFYSGDVSFARSGNTVLYTVKASFDKNYGGIPGEKPKVGDEVLVGGTGDAENYEGSFPGGPVFFTGKGAEKKRVALKVTSVNDKFITGTATISVEYPAGTKSITASYRGCCKPVHSKADTTKKAGSRLSWNVEARVNFADKATPGAVSLPLLPHIVGKKTEHQLGAQTSSKAGCSGEDVSSCGISFKLLDGSADGLTVTSAGVLGVSEAVKAGMHNYIVQVSQGQNSIILDGMISAQSGGKERAVDVSINDQSTSLYHTKAYVDFEGSLVVASADSYGASSLQAAFTGISHVTVAGTKVSVKAASGDTGFRSVCVGVTGSEAQSAQKCISMDVLPEPAPKFLEPKGSTKTTYMGCTLTFPVTAFDANEEYDSVKSIGPKGKLPSGSALAKAVPQAAGAGMPKRLTRILTWRCNADQGGFRSPFCFSATDTRGNTASKCVQVTCSKCKWCIQHPTESLRSVADRFGTNWLAIYAVNPTMPHPDYSPVAGEAVSVGHTLAVEEGETLAEIAKKYGTTVATIKKLNAELQSGYSFSIDTNKIPAGHPICIVPDGCVSPK